jgi:hypothetical protein
MKILGHDIPWLDEKLAYTLGFVAIIFLALGVSSCEVKRAKIKQANAEAVAFQKQREGDAALMDLNGAKISLLTLQAKNNELTQQVKSAEAKLASHPIPLPVPIPADKDMAGYLVDHGLKTGLVISNLPSSNFALEDSKTVFSWQSEAARVPGLLDRDAASLGLITSLGNKADGLNASLAVAQAGLTDCDKMHRADEEQKSALKDVATQANKRAQVENRRGWYKAGAAAVIFFLAGRGTK